MKLSTDVSPHISDVAIVLLDASAMRVSLSSDTEGAVAVSHLYRHVAQGADAVLPSNRSREGEAFPDASARGEGTRSYPRGKPAGLWRMIGGSIYGRYRCFQSRQKYSSTYLLHFNMKRRPEIQFASIGACPASNFGG